MSDAICPDCGERNARGAEFCGGCGAFLAWDATDPADSPGPAPVPVPPPAARDPGPPRSASPAPAPVQFPAAAQHPSPAARPAPAPRVPPTVPPPTTAPPVMAPAAAPLTPASRRTWYQPPPVSAPAPAPAPPVVPPPQPIPAAAPPEPDPPPVPLSIQCPRCGVANETDRRFCAKCGLGLVGPRLHDAGPAGAPPPPERLSWWRRIFRPAPNTRRAARIAYRQSLPLRYRAIRWVLALVGVGAIVGGLSLIGRNPVGWAVDRWNDLRGTTVQVTGLQAHSEPPAEGPDAAPLLLDNLADTGWTAPWTTTSALDPVLASCRNPADPTMLGMPPSVVVTLPQEVSLNRLSVAAGLPKDDSRRAQQYRPKALQLAFTDGTCQRVELADADGLQMLPLETVRTGAVRIWVASAYSPASDQPQDIATIAEVRLFQRP